MQKVSLDQCKSFYNELTENGLIIRDIDFLEWFVSLLMAYEFS